MKIALASLLLAASPAALQAETDWEEPDAEVVEAALADLEEAFDDKELTPDGRALAVQRNGDVDHPDVIEVFADLLKDSEEMEVREACVEALRYLRHPDALESLHKRWKKDKKKWKKETAFAATVIRAIAQHADPESVELIADDMFSIGGREVAKAKILGLGHIRSYDSVDELMSVMKAGKRSHIQSLMTDFRMSLMVLTGVDNGESQDEWIDWWSDNKKDLEIRAEPHLLPKKEQYQWDRYWGYDRMDDRGQKREDRGDDPETDDPVLVRRA